MTSDELRNMAVSGLLRGSFTTRTHDALLSSADTIERLQRENAEAERLLKLAQPWLLNCPLNVQDEVNSHLSRTARHEGA